MDDLVGDFVADVQDGYERASADLEAWTRAPDNRPALDGLFRFIHTVKGNAGFLGLARFERLCDAAERALDAVRRGNRKADGPLVSGVAAIINRVGALADAIAGGVALPAHDEPTLVRALGYEPLDKAGTPRPATIEKARQHRTIRMPTEQFDHLAQCFESVAASHRLVLHMLAGLPESALLAPALDGMTSRIDALGQALTASRQQNVGRIFAGLDRIVADTARALGKDVRLEISGDDVMADRDVVDALRDPVLHCVRNALDHGMEPPELRNRSGKAAQGAITIGVRTEGSDLVVTISDDGRGVDLEAVQKLAADAGVAIACAPEQLDSRQIRAILTAPGITTARESTSLSGRGVGLDAVANALDRLGGSLRIDTRPGLGMVLTLKVPLRASGATSHAA